MSGKQLDSAAEVKPDKQVVFMLGESMHASNGDRRTVSPELAASLVERGLARYPANHQG